MSEMSEFERILGSAGIGTIVQVHKFCGNIFIFTATGVYRLSPPAPWYKRLFVWLKKWSAKWSAK